ncbi:MAG TPA: Fe-S cluster assembly protein SufD [Gemmatimonadota bacterium]|nr:Fe-S cluster assembly protein SufD [Gemmatimonadota bacterium]
MGSSRVAQAQAESRERLLTADIETAPSVRGEIGPETVEAIVRERSEPEWMAARRRHAWQVYRETPMPTTKDEAWRYTDLAKIAWQDLRMRDPSPPERVAARGELPVEIREELARRGKSAAFAVQHNGVQLYSEFSDELAREGVLFLDFDSAVSDYAELMQKYFMTDAVTPEFGKLAALHGAFVSGGTVLYVPAGVEIELPLTTFRWLDLEGVAVFPHTLVIAGPESQVTYIEECASPARAQKGLAMNCGVTEIVAEEGARVRYAIVQQWGRHVFHYQAARVFAHKDAQIQSLLVTLGASVARSDVETDLQAEGANSEMLGIYLGDSDQHFDHYTYQLHQAPHAGSDLLYKGALKDRARSVFRGMIRVMPGAQGTDAYQTNRNLILSEDAHADSLPNLEIEADDVRCSHGATIGQQDEQQIFYLMSRGLSREQAEKLIVSGFFEEVLARVPVDWLHRRLSDEIERKLG